MSDTSAIEHDSTSLVTVLSSDHGRQRRAERRIGKRDLQAAVKYGVRGMGFPCPRTGAIRYKFTYADVVYITDETCRQEITSWPAPGAGFDMALKEITPAAAAAHARARATLHASPGSWTSHTVIVVDQSGSMRRPDVADGATRSDAVWVTLAHAFVKEQLESGTARDTDVVSLVAMNDGGTLLLDREPLDWLLYNRLVELLRSAEPKSRGNYLPALDQAEECLLHNTHGSCALLLMFLSDGRPSDCPPRGPGHSVIKLRAAVRARLSGLASRFGRRLTVGMIGFGPPGEDFSLLSSMAECCTPYGSSGVFQRPDMSIDALRSVFTSLSSTLTATKVELTKLGGSAQRTVRDVRREPVGADYMLLGSDLSLDLEDWFYYDSATDIESRVRWSPAARTWEELLTFISEGAVGVAMHQSIFGEGAERMVRQFREVDVSGWFVGQPLVAKESRFLEDLDNDDLRHFHRTFCETQFRAQELAQAFNRRLERIPGVDASTPRISFLECSVYVVQDSKRGWIGVLVEKMLDPGRYKKWNNNAGHVHGMAALQWQQPPAAGATASQEPALAPGGAEWVLVKCTDTSSGICFAVPRLLVL